MVTPTQNSPQSQSAGYMLNSNQPIHTRTEIHSKDSLTNGSQIDQNPLHKALNKIFRIFAAIFGMSENRIQDTKKEIEAILKRSLDPVNYDYVLFNPSKIFINVRVGNKYLQFPFLPNSNDKESAVQKAGEFFENEMKKNPFARTYGCTTLMLKKSKVVKTDVLEASVRKFSGKNWGMLYSSQKSYSAGDYYNPKGLHSSDEREQLVQFINKKLNLSLTRTDLSTIIR